MHYSKGFYNGCAKLKDGAKSLCKILHSKNMKLKIKHKQLNIIQVNTIDEVLSWTENLLKIARRLFENMIIETIVLYFYKIQSLE